MAYGFHTGHVCLVRTAHNRADQVYCCMTGSSVVAGTQTGPRRVMGHKSQIEISL